MSSQLAAAVLAELEECLLKLDDLGCTLAGAQLCQAIETVRAELAEMDGQVPLIGVTSPSF
jgi:hypothetical protein